ncbi:SHOCT domain-containing protein [Intrasporangium sp.]|uniref:SHOCT domain-containing protein n=1 Tax=Intrasporangium sp. TaxID=1925024 RepID=UPI002B46A87F|nr:SHOCT domain-containing protein [Intrasporangium sp.]
MFDDNGSFLLAMFEFFIFVAWIMCLFYVFGDVFRSRDLGGVAKTLWCVFIIVLPFLGVFVYLIARGNGMTQRSMEARQQLLDQQAQYVRSVAASNGGGSGVDEIASAKKLLDDGAISQTEFEQLKARALATTNVGGAAGA